MAQTQLHPRVEALRTLYQTDPTACYRELYREVIQTAETPNALRSLTSLNPARGPARMASIQPPKNWAPTDRFWRRLHVIYSGQGVGGGLRASVTNVSDRTTSFFAPYAAEFLGIWSEVDPAVAKVAIGLRAAQLAHMGIDHVKLWYPFNAWKYRDLDEDGHWGSPSGSHSVELVDVLRILARNGIDKVTLTMGNSFGLYTTADDTFNNARYVFHTQGDGSPLPSQKKLLLVDKDADTFYATPGDDYLHMLSSTQFTDFKTGDWTSYSNFMASLTASEANVFALQLWNEAEQSLDPTFTNAAPRTGELIERARVRAAAYSVDDRLMIGVGGTDAAETYFFNHLDQYSPHINDGWLTYYIRYYGFHPAAALKHTDAAYNAGSRRFIGWPPETTGAPYQPLGLFAASGGITVTGLIDGFMTLHNGEIAILEELVIRQAVPQVLTDVDKAFQVQSTGESTVGLGPWSAAAAPRHGDNTALADGTIRLPREQFPLQNRWRLGGSGHSGSSFSGSGLGPADAKVHPLPGNPTPKLSRAVRPHLFESPRDITGAGNHESTLLVYSDPYDDVPTHSHYASFPATTRSGERHGIWVRAIFKDGTSGTEFDTEVVRLSGVIVSGPTDFGNLTEDPSFRDVDDNRLYSAWPAAVVPTKGSNLTFPSTLRAWALDPILEFTTREANGFAIALDATWKSLDRAPNPDVFAVPVPANPCPWSGFFADIPGVERELMVREPIQRMVRATYSGVSGRVAGVFLRETEDTPTSELGHHYVLAFHRLVWKDQRSDNEHYGPAQDALDGSLTAARIWSANYGDVFFNKKRHPLDGSAISEPAKMEIVLVDVYVIPSFEGGTVSVSATSSLLPTYGDLPTPIDPIGAEAWDPVLATPGDGTLVAAYRKAQDAHFEFPEQTDGSTSWYPTASGSKLQGPTVTDSCGTYLPITYPSSTTRVDWPAFHNAMTVRMFPRDLFMRLRTAAGTWSNEVRLSEPAYPDGTDFRKETWTATSGGSWLGDLKNLEDRNGTLRDLKNYPGGFEKQFHEGWVNSSVQNLAIREGNPHTWHPALQPSLSVVPRDGSGQLRVGVAWSQWPRALRVAPTTGTPPYLHAAYAVRGLRLLFSSSNSLITGSSSTSYLDYASDALLGLSTPSSVRTADSIQGPVSVVLRPALQSSTWTAGDSSRAFFQMGKSVYGVLEGQTSGYVADSSAGVVRVRSIKAAGIPYDTQIALPGGDSELELAAWIQPHGTADNKKQYLAFHASVPRRSWESGVQTIASTSFETEDPNAEVIAVFAHVSGTGSSTKGRIVWKAEGTIWWVDLTWGNQSITAGTVSRANSTLPGPFPAREIEAHASPSAVAWTHDGTVLTLKFP